MFKKSKKLMFSASLVGMLAACSTTMPVSGQLLNGTETFTGSGEAGMSTGAPFTMTSSRGTACSGTFDMKSLSGGLGVFSCDDGRSGTFDWVAQGGKLAGTGAIAGAPMTLTMG
jgi:hypothetical protein